MCPGFGIFNSLQNLKPEKRGGALNKSKSNTLFILHIDLSTIILFGIEVLDWIKKTYK